MLDSNLPEGGNPALEINYGSFGQYIELPSPIIAVSGVIEMNGESSGTGVSWSLDGGETWQYINQPTDTDDSFNWYTETLTNYIIPTTINNVTYDLSIDRNNEHI